MSSPTREQLKQRLAPFGQEHVLRFWDELDEAGRAKLTRQLEAIDFARLEKLARGTEATDDVAALAARAEPPSAIRLDDPKNRFSKQEAIERGQELLASGKVGVILVAGGEGTRLGFNAPKGMYKIGPVSQASLLQILFEKTLAVGERYGVRLPLYVMTSPSTHDSIDAFLKEHDNFGLPAADVRLFCQSTMPAVDALTGKLLLAKKDSLALSPDGHGGMLAALVRSGSLDDIERRGLSQLFYFQVDNALAPVADPELLGYHLLFESEASTQVVGVRADHLREKTGRVVVADGRTRIVEYSTLEQLDDDIFERRTPRGELVFWAGNIAVHVFDTAFLRRVSGTQSSASQDRSSADSNKQQLCGLPFHLAHKAVPHLDARGNVVEPKSPNAFKFEQFIFDLLPEAKNAIVVEVDRATCFAPLKNRSGADSAETVRAQMIALHRHWLEESGGVVAPNVPIEISPRVALDAQQLATRLPGGVHVRQATYIDQAFVDEQRASSRG